MTYKDLITLYEDKKKIYGNDAYKHISELLRESKENHKKFALQNGVNDIEQSWRAFKGKNLEKMIEYIITDEVKKLGLSIINGNKLERKRNFEDKTLDLVKRNLCIDYGEYGLHLPDVDIIIYDDKTNKIIAVLSIKVTLRERIAQTGYWKLKLMQSSVTKHIKVLFITLDEDGVLSIKKPSKKGRAIAEADTDGCYILTESNIEESKRVKLFSDFIDDLNKIINNIK
ncbi:BsaWI family type II restriction enzyme [uncultured Brachyspira sp.]|uniref:BsaWI family type II restriction enzyme n=1 Tax=uncultured Brachyspira sp. TaxID=221953 RepID=UPI0025D1B605|nr:BsaWI family type II restriction enzyme [uncultured Brachyspira sp.]